MNILYLIRQFCVLHWEENITSVGCESTSFLSCRHLISCFTHQNNNTDFAFIIKGVPLLVDDLFTTDGSAVHNYYNLYPDGSYSFSYDTGTVQYSTA